MAWDPNDGGYRSRKMWLTYIVLALGTAAFIGTAKWASLAIAIGEYYMFLLAASSIYAGGNAAVKWMAVSKGAKVEPKATPAPTAPVKPAVTTTKQGLTAEQPSNPNAD